MKETGYCLNNEIIFIPAQRILVRRDGKTKPIILNEPTAKILKTLLTYNGITPQKELYESAWENQGAKATPNNLYQNVSLLRRSLNSIFLRKDDYIITAPRKGFYISPDIHITIISDECIRPLPDAHSTLSTPADAVGGLPQTALTKTPGRLRKTLAGAINKYRTHRRSLLLVILGALILNLYHVAASRFWTNDYPKNHDFFCDEKKQ